MPDPKVLTPAVWKTVSVKCKVQNNDLLKALMEYDKLDDDDHDELLDTIADIRQTALALKKSKEAASNKELLKYIGDLISAAEAEQRDVTKDKAETEKKEKAAEAKTKDEDEDEEKEGDEEDEEEGEYQDKLLMALKKLKGSKGVAYQFIVCDGKPPAVMIAKKISPKHKDELAKVTGSKRFLHVGQCSFDGSHYAFDMEKPVSGLAKKLQESLKHHTGKRHPIRVGTEAAGAEDEGAATGAEAAKAASGAAAGIEDGRRPADLPPSSNDQRPVTAAPPAPSGPLAISASVGQGGKNKPADVTLVQNALNAKAKAGLKVDFKCGPKTIAAIKAFQKQMGMAKPDGRIDPGRGTARALSAPGPLPPAPAAPNPVAAPKLGKAELAKAPGIWHGMRDVIDKNIGELKKAIKAHYAHEHPDLITEIEKNLGKLDGITEKLDHRIADSLKKAQAAKDEAAKKLELKNAKTILSEYISFVKSEPLIAHVDSNPWVKIDLKKTVVDHITHMAQAIG